MHSVDTDDHHPLYGGHDHVGQHVKNVNNLVDNVNTVNSDESDDDSNDTDDSGTASSHSSRSSLNRSGSDEEHAEGRHTDDHGHHESDYDSKESDVGGGPSLTKEDLQSVSQEKLDVEGSSKQDLSADAHPGPDANNSESNDTGKEKGTMYYSDSSVLEAFTDAKTREPETAYPIKCFLLRKQVAIW